MLVYRTYSFWIFGTLWSKNINNKTCFKNPARITCIDLFITNSSHSFQNTMTISTGFMIITILKSSFIKSKDREIYYRNYRNFSSNSFREDLTLSLDRINLRFFWRHFHENSQQTCASEKEICQSKWGTLYD